MTDIVELLRAWPGPKPNLIQQAADEIERLRLDYDHAKTAYVQQFAEIERLTAATTGLRAALGRETEDRKKAEAEVERLRASLLEVAQGTNEDWTHDNALRVLESPP